MEGNRHRDREPEVYRPEDQEEGGSNSDAAPPTNGGLPLGSSPLVLLRLALGRIVQRRHGGRQGGVRIKPCWQWERGWRVWNVEETGTSPIAEPAGPDSLDHGSRGVGGPRGYRGHSQDAGRRLAKHLLVTSRS